MLKKIIYFFILPIILLFPLIIYSQEKGTNANKKNHISSKDFKSRELVPSGRWQWRLRWHLNEASQWNIYQEDTSKAGRWTLPQSKVDDYSLSYIRYKGYYSSKIPYAARGNIYHYNGFRPSHYFSRFRYHHRYYPFGYFYWHYYPRTFISIWAFPFWSWYWYPSWWISLDYWYPPYFYYNYWYPRRYYIPSDPEHNKYFARLRTNIEPEDAIVYLDGHFIGKAEEHNGWWKTFPIKAGKHQATIKLPGFKTEIVDFEVAPSQYFELKLKMTPVEKPQLSENNFPLQEDIEIQKGYLNLLIEPDNSSIYIDNKYIGNYEDIKNSNNQISIPIGTHTIDVLSPSYLPFKSKFTIKENEELTLTIKLIKKELI